MKRMVVLVLAGSLAAALLVAGVGATSTPLWPQRTSKVTTLHPLFRWQLPANEIAETVGIATSPRTTATGEFDPQDTVGLDALDADATSHAFDQPIGAGKYWWHVASHVSSDPADHLFTPPTPFTIRATVSKPIVSLRLAGRSFLVTVHWQANVGTVQVKERLLAGTKQVASTKATVAGILGQPGQELSPWSIPGSVKRGTRLRFAVTVTASAPGTAKSVTTTKTFRSP
jgi:hypothetical protein